MFVVKRDGRREPVMFDKITARISKLCYGLNMDFVDPVPVAQKVVQGVYSGVSTTELDNLSAETAAYMATQHPDYAVLAARIAVSNLHKDTKKVFSEVVTDLYEYVDPKSGKKAPLIADDVYAIVQQNKDRLDSAIVYDRDFSYDYFGFKTLERAYLLKLHGKIAERPQHMLMRVSVGIHKDDIEAAIETYNFMSEKWFIHASPTLFNSGTPVPQLSSCFLLAMKDDSISGIYSTLSDCAMISKTAGGIGLAAHCIRAKGSYIRGTNGMSNGLIPMLRVFNSTARYVDQGGGKRPGAFAVYLEPWHADVFEFLELRKNHGAEENRARDLFYALWVPDLFMQRVHEDGEWSLFCPNEAPGLFEVYGDEFEELYARYEREGRARRTVRAQTLWFAILDSQIETGTPYMLFKDAANKKSNQKNLGTIKSSNLCTEIIEYTAADETAVCNLASVSLPKFVVTSGGNAGQSVRLHPNEVHVSYDFKTLHKVVKVMTRNLNKVIDINYYPIPEARNSNMRHRPIGLGVQGLADAFIMMGYAFDSDEAKLLNRQIFETVYHAALEASCELAAEHGPYSTYEGSPVSQGILQYDMWGVTPTDLWNWAELKEKIAEHGVRNSLLLAPMPTASTSQILGNNEMCEPYTSNIYTRRVIAGEFTVVNPHLLKDLTELGLWNNDLKNRIIANRGSVQGVDEVPEHLRKIYRTCWELKMRSLIDLAADRGAYIDQSQSLNLFVAEPNYARLTSMHFYSWRKGLKTGMYYLRTKPAADAIQFTVDKSKLRSKASNEAGTEEAKENARPLAKKAQSAIPVICTDEVCTSCSG